MIINPVVYKQTSSAESMQTVTCTSSWFSFYADCIVTVNGEKLSVPKNVRSSGASNIRKDSLIDIPKTSGGFPVIITPSDALDLVGEHTASNEIYQVYRVIKDFSINIDD